MPSTYLAPSDYAAWGVSSTTAHKVQQASGLVDNYLRRPEGLVWMPDSAGLPAYMAALTPTLTTTLSAPIAPGVSVTTPLTIAAAGMSDLVGEVFVIGRGTDACEALTVTGIDTARATVTFAKVVHAHSAGDLLEAGLVILEERQVAEKRSLTRASRSPIVRLVSGLGRYSYGRRSQQVAGLYNDTHLLNALQTFGGPPQWAPFDVASASISVATGEIWVPAGLMLAYYSEVRIRYLAGFPAAGVPNAIKGATAAIIRKLDEFGDADAMFKTVSAGGTKLERFTDTMFDAQLREALAPYELKLLF